MVRNLHDGLSQQLMGASMLSHVIMTRMAKEGNSCVEEMTQLDRYLKKASEDLKALYKTLEPTLEAKESG